MNNKSSLKTLFSFIISTLFMTSCSVQHQISNIAGKELFADPALMNAHTGIYVYDASANKELYSNQGNKYFIPASNTKIATCYAAMRFLGDSLKGIRYTAVNDTVFLYPTGDPTLLHWSCSKQPVIDFLKQQKKTLQLNISSWKEEALGEGWAWDDYNDYYMAERSVLPVYGNTVLWTQLKQAKENPLSASDSIDTYFTANPGIGWKIQIGTKPEETFSVKRDRSGNLFHITEGKEKEASAEVPFVTSDMNTILQILKDTVYKELGVDTRTISQSAIRNSKSINSQPTDSVLKAMMFRSDNFFAEQLLLMTGNELLGYMNDGAAIDTLLRSALKDIPQKPRWVDGSGLSRYNLFTPQDFVFILQKAKDEFGMERLKTVLPTGGQGTISRYYNNLTGKIFAKTGSLSNNTSISGYLYTKQNKLFIFSVLVNAHPGSATPVRRAVERFITTLYNNF